MAAPAASAASAENYLSVIADNAIAPARFYLPPSLEANASLLELSALSDASLDYQISTTAALGILERLAGLGAFCQQQKASVLTFYGHMQQLIDFVEQQQQPELTEELQQALQQTEQQRRHMARLFRQSEQYLRQQHAARYVNVVEQRAKAVASRDALFAAFALRHIERATDLLPELVCLVGQLMGGTFKPADYISIHAQPQSESVSQPSGGSAVSTAPSASGVTAAASANAAAPSEVTAVKLGKATATAAAASQQPSAAPPEEKDKDKPEEGSSREV